MALIQQTTAHDPLSKKARARLREMISNEMLLLFVDSHNSTMYLGDFHNSWHVLLIGLDDHGQQRASATNISALIAQALSLPYTWDDDPSHAGSTWNSDELLANINITSIMVRLAHILYPDSEYPIHDPKQYARRIEFEGRARVL